MPRVVIELQANTQDAVNKIQQFARAQRDAFDAIKAGNPALADATVKVSTLTQAYAGLTKSQEQFARQGPPAAAGIQTVTRAVTDARGAVIAYGTASAQQKAATSKFLDDLASGATKSEMALEGFRKVTRSLITDIPVVGPMLAKLATTFGTFPLLIGGVVGAGVGLLKFLDDLSTKATVSLERVTALGRALANAQALTNLEVQGIQAGAAGNAAGALAFGAAGARARAQQARDAAIETARQQAESERPGVLSLEGFADVATQGGRMGALAKQDADVAEKVTQARIAAEGHFALEIRKIDEQLKADLNRLETDYDATLKEHQEERVKDAKDAAEKQAKLLEDLLTKSTTIFKGLGADFKGATQSLELAQFVKDSTAAIDTLKQAFENGIIKQDAYTQGTRALTEKMQEAIQLGYVPVAEAVAAVAATMDDAVNSAAAWRAELAATMPWIDDLIRKGAELQAQAGGGVAAAASGLSSVQTAMPALAFSASSGGVGMAVRPEAGGGGVRIESGAVQITGTVIQQDRDWSTLIDTLGQSLAARGR